MVLACIIKQIFMGYREIKAVYQKQSTWNPGFCNSLKIDCVKGPEDKF